ncbi:phosphoenolpyruvate--protein phosphotransferase [Aliicoccus persicus]|uniref:Phosphoenolpyruvate-protein phosphotransferase n=1 Tax=Aliicoccus persicus TaxID=930138 RepID=A0A662Z024_9STAP|nr:phosphoenolpyruvate--protein phosphotransferase [Aliicoccus persicus]SEV79980.1 phosphoenolpyruvate--protein phosphotransferase [Aliicoccus persicus]
MSKTTIDGRELVRGIAISKAWVLEENQSVFETRLNLEAVDTRIERFQFALHETQIELMKIRNYTEDRIGKQQAAIFDAHMMVIDDPVFVQAIESRIQSGIDPVEALDDWRKSSQTKLSHMNDYLKVRSADVDDITIRIARHLVGTRTFDATQVDEEIIFVAEKLTPSFIASLNPEFVKGIIVAEASPFSHATMLAQAMGIPLMQVDRPGFSRIKHGASVIIDTEASLVIVNPDADNIRAFEIRRDAYLKSLETLQSLKDKDTRTQDNVAINLMMNVNELSALKHYEEVGAEGIGLVRSEFLFNGDKDLSKEETQVDLYRSILKSVPENDSVTIRMLDYGGDKQMMLDDEVENNPFLGTRGMRYLFKHIDLLLTQLRALFRASMQGNLQILFPFVTTVDELKDILRIVDQVKTELKEEAHPFDDDVKIGVMIETPGAALMAGEFSDMCDFLSVGTNDLAQYMFAADRTNANVAKYNDAANPAMLKIIKHVVEQGKNADTPVCVCGDIARDALMIPLLIGLGVRNLSMDHTHILKSRQQISRLSVTSVEKLAQHAVECTGGEQVRLLVKDFINHL